MYFAKLEVLKGPKNFGSLNGQSDPSASLAVGQFVVRHLARNHYIYILIDWDATFSNMVHTCLGAQTIAQGRLAG